MNKDEREIKVNEILERLVKSHPTSFNEESLSEQEKNKIRNTLLENKKRVIERYSGFSNNGSGYEIYLKQARKYE